MNLYIVYWNIFDKDEAHGFVRASSPEEAREIAEDVLKDDRTVTEVYRAHEGQVGPKSMTLNFQNWKA